VGNEIDKNMYCAANCFRNKNCCLSHDHFYSPLFESDCIGAPRTYPIGHIRKTLKPVKECYFYRHKHPTPEQYKKEYREPVPNNMPAFVLNEDHWELFDYERYLRIMDICHRHDKQFGTESAKNNVVVIACTPFGKPDKDWRPE